MFYRIYNVCLSLAFPVIIGLLLVKKRLQRGIGPRLGLVPAHLHRLSRPVIWIHAVSLGEVVAVVPLLKILKQAIPQGSLVVSTVTETGKEALLSRVPDIALHCYAPLDFSWAVQRYLNVIDPTLFILVEAELWPNLLRSLQNRRVPVCLINGRISSRSYHRYRYVRGFIRQMLGCLTLALMQTQRDAERMIELGGNPAKIRVTGNLKFDWEPEQGEKTLGSALSRASIGLFPNERLWVAGSTHPREEEELLEAYHIVLKTHPDVVLMLAPRHIERTSKVEHVVRKFGLYPVRRSCLETSTEATGSFPGQRVVILDTRGELAQIYQFGQLAFVGGTLVPVGGHNLLEPAQWGVPVLFGPHIDHCEEISRLLLDGGGGVQVRDARDLAQQVVELLKDAEASKRMGERAMDVVHQHRGVVQRTLQMILELMSHTQDSVQPAGSPKVLGRLS